MSVSVFDNVSKKGWWKKRKRYSDSLKSQLESGLKTGIKSNVGICKDPRHFFSLSLSNSSIPPFSYLLLIFYNKL